MFGVKCALSHYRELNLALCESLKLHRRVFKAANLAISDFAT